MIRKSAEADAPAILAIVNAAAQAYRGVIPADRWHEPYMPAEELASEITDGVIFWVAEEEGRVLGVMGIQDKGEVALVRHAYVDPGVQRKGVGTRLLRHVQGLTAKPVLIGTWAAASWAIDFYRRNGFDVVPVECLIEPIDDSVRFGSSGDGRHTVLPVTICPSEHRRCKNCKGSRG